MAEIAKWLETDQSPKLEHRTISHNQLLFQNNIVTNDSMLSGPLQWTKSAPSSPLSPASSPGNDNRITRSASSR